MSIADKLNSILNIKNQLKSALSTKGVVINDLTPFSDYPSKVQSIVAQDMSVGSAEYTVTATDVKLTKVIFPTTAKVLQSYCIYNSPYIKEIVVQEGTTKLSSYALFQTPNAEKITLPTTLTTVETYALALNNQLLEINIPSNVNLNNSTFLLTNNTKLKKINISSCLLTTNIPTSFADNNTALTQVLLPTNVSTIGASAFSGCSSLTNFDFSNIVSVGSNGFSNAGLTSLNMPKATNIASGSFNGVKVTHGIFPKMSVVGVGALSNCTLAKYFEFGTSLTSVGQAAITNSSKLEAIVIKATTPPIIESDSFPSSGTYKIYVPDASVTAYKAIYNWMFFTNRITPMSEFVMPTL